MEQKFTKVRSTKDIAIFTSLIIIGLVLATIPEFTGANLGGYTLIALGLALACFLKSNYKDIETQKTYLKKEFTFDGNMKPTILSALNTLPESLDLSKDGNGQGLMLKVYYSKMSPKVYMQLFEYVPHIYEPCSEVYEYEMDIVKKLIK